MFVCVGYNYTDLDVHPEEANIDTILLLKSKHGSGSIGEVIHHFTSVDISAQFDFNAVPINVVLSLTSVSSPA